LDPKQIVADGYDRIAERHAIWASGIRVDEREYYTALVLATLPVGAAVLDLGCGVGVPTTKRLAERFQVTGVDISPRHVETARRNVPDATFVQCDMTALELPAASLDGVTAFYSITHVPREEHGSLLQAIGRWLRPRGLLVAAMGARESAGDVEDDWLGAPMYFSHYDSTTNVRLVEQAGLSIVSAREEAADEDGVPTMFLWVVARKP
jgi:ubiquinone/menaquinone biosynthesis C-methylase UbiE